jgi:lipopolysaccharide transport system ATP-binding protein
MGHIQVRDLGKAYKLYKRRWHRLSEWLSPRSIERHEKRWVLRNLNFQVEKGETVGIVGRNGAGKSTLLKLLTGTMEASEGEIRVEGRIAALLELGMGFHPEFTGRQNVYMAGQLLGMSQQVIDARMPDILAFAEIGDAIDQPVRTYSSGMQVRLAFSLATATRPEILIVDEALSVGDTYFQHKCFRRIRQFKEEGVTLLFVSHDALAVKSLCDRAILLEKGSVAMDGPPDAVLDYYNALIALDEANAEEHERKISRSDVETRSGNQRARIENVGLLNDGRVVQHVYAGDPLAIRVTYVVLNSLDDLTVGILIRDRLGNDVYGTNTHLLGYSLPTTPIGRRLAVDFRFEAFNLGPGSYSITAALHRGYAHVVENYDWWDQVVTFPVSQRGGATTFIGIAKLDALIETVPVELAGSSDHGEREYVL